MILEKFTTKKPVGGVYCYNKYSFSFSERTFSEFMKIWEETPAHLPNAGWWKGEDSFLPGSSGFGHSRNWFGEGIKTLDDVKMLFEKGWKEGGKRALELKEQLLYSLPVAKSRKRKLQWRDNGDELHIDRALKGEWDSAWRTSKREIAEGQTVCELQVNWGGNCGMSSEQLFWSGAGALVAADILEDAGYAVRIVAVLNNSGTNGLQHARIIIKESDEPVRVDALAATLCHAGVFRTYGFRAICEVPWLVHAGLGHMEPWESSIPALKECGLWNEDAIKMRETYDRHACLDEIARIVMKVQGTLPSEEQGDDI